MVDCWKGTVEMETDSMGRVTPKSQINTWTPLSVPLQRELSSLCLLFLHLSSLYHQPTSHTPSRPCGVTCLCPPSSERALCECVYLCELVSERVCVSGLLISLGCCRFKLFIPTAPAHTHTHAHLHHMPARIRPPQRRSPWQPYQRSQISAREMK